MQSANGKDKIWIFDTTLRDGEQALRASLSHKQKIQLAHAIARLNVDVMEVGFPVSSPGDFASVQAIAQSVKGPIICGLSRAVFADIDACGEALKDAERRRIHTFIATSPLHLQYKLRKTLAQATSKQLLVFNTLVATPTMLSFPVKMPAAHRLMTCAGLSRPPLKPVPALLISRIRSAIPFRTNSARSSTS